MRHLFLISCLTFTLLACSSNDYNPTVYNYEFNADLVQENKIKHIMIAPINYGVPSRHYLISHEDQIDESVKKILQESNISLVSNKSFQSLWKKAILAHGSLFDKSTGLMLPAFKTALEETMQRIFELNPGLDAILFTDLLETPIKYSNTTKKVARWDGAQRKVKVQGDANGLTDEFNWSQSVDGISIGIYLFNREQQLILHNVGGIQIAQAIDLKNNSGSFKRRNDLLNDDDDIKEGIHLALHPFIPMKNYPKKTE